jgi:serine/threonine protein kinase
MTQEAYPDALPAHYRLHWYELERVLGQGGFGITYLAHDHNLDLPVAIKEYLPIDVAQRRSDASVRPRTQPFDERYRWGLERFIEEARTLARFDHPNIVRVQSVFEANDTAYMVMRYEQGENLGTLLDRRGTLGQDELLRVLLPIVDGLERVHEAGFIHRDIKPENIHIRADGSPVLLDFGSARFAPGRSRAMTVLVAPGYAPLEQYDGEARTQGPWTDIYGLAATAYRAMAGVPPPDAVLRVRGRLGSTTDTLVPAASLGQGRYSAALLAAIDHGLQLAEADRPQSMAAWRDELVGDSSAPPPAAPSAARWAAPTSSHASIVPAPPVFAPAPVSEAVASARPFGLPFALGAGAIALAGGAWLLWPRAPSAPVSPAAGPSAPASRPTDVAAAPPAASAVVASAPTTAPMQAPSPVAAPLSEAIPAPAVAPPPQATGRPARTVVAPAGPTAVPEVRRPAQRDAGKGPDIAPSVPATASAPAPAASPASAAVQVAIAAQAAPASAAAAPALDPLNAANEALRQGDGALAYRLARPLGDTGHPGALELLGRLAEEGRGTVPNALQAYIWYSLAVKRGQATARPAAERMARRLQPAEIAQADRLVQNWRPQ